MIDNDMECHICQASYKEIDATRFKCRECGHVYQFYNGDVVDYHRHLYRNLKSHHRSDGEFDENGNVTPAFHKARLGIVSKRIERLKGILDPSFVCIDVGAGAGTFAQALKPYIARVQCLELPINLVNECKRLGFDTYSGDFLTIPLRPKSFDIVFAWHVLEHVAEPVLFLKQCANLSSQYVVIEIPFGRKVKDEFDGHSHHFSNRSIIKAFEKAGLNIVTNVDGIQKPSKLLVGKV